MGQTRVAEAEPGTGIGSRDDAVQRKIEALRAGERPAERDLRGAQLTGQDLSGLDLSGFDLSQADLSRSDLRGAKLAGAVLRGTILFGADLGGCQLLRADLTGADLSECRAAKTGFGGADLTDATLFQAELEQATFTRAVLHGADLRAANLRGARLQEVDLGGVDLSRADLRQARLVSSRVEGACFADVDLREARICAITGFKNTNWIGANIVDVDFRGAYMLRRRIMDENYLYEFRRQSRYFAALYWIWWVTSDCGRSFLRWALWTLLAVVTFAGLFEMVALDYGDHPTFLSSLYYSLVTITTLGYGDVVPASPGAQLLAMCEVTLGYFMLGGLLGIFANKMARRAD